MNRVELKQRLDKANVNPQAYSLYGELVNDALVLEEVYGKWHVFYFERGNRDMERVFDSEDNACSYFYSTLKDEPSVKW